MTASAIIKNANIRKEGQQVQILRVVGILSVTRKKTLGILSKKKREIPEKLT
jgi:hypothetical protein